MRQHRLEVRVDRRLALVGSLWMTLLGSARASAAVPATVLAVGQCDPSLKSTEAWFATELRKQTTWLKRTADDPKTRASAAEEAWVLALRIPANVAALKARGVTLGSVQERCLKSGVILRLVTESTVAVPIVKPVNLPIGVPPMGPVLPVPRNVTIAVHLMLSCQVERVDPRASFTFNAVLGARRVALNFVPGAEEPDAYGRTVVTYTATGTFVPGSYAMRPGGDARVTAMRMRSWSPGPFSSYVDSRECMRHERRFEGRDLTVTEEPHEVYLDLRNANFGAALVITDQSRWVHINGDLLSPRGASLPPPSPVCAKQRCP